MRLETAASLALLYLILYTILFAHLIVLYVTRKVPVQSRYTFITFHVLIRLASQAVGLAFALVGHVPLLVAYFVLGAEGYFTLVLCSYRFLIAWHREHFISGESWLEPKRAGGEKWFKKAQEAFTFYTPGRGIQWMGLTHCHLIVGNTLIVVGGTLLSGGNDTVETFGSDDSVVRNSTVFRTVGQTIFLVINIGLLLAIGLTVAQERSESNQTMGEEEPPQSSRHVHSAPSTVRQNKPEDDRTMDEPSPRPSRYPHPTLIILLAAWPLLIVRGFYGLLNPFIDAFNYFVANNYDDNGLTLEFVTYEYVLGTTMEWISCALLIGTWWAEKWWPGIRVEHERDTNEAQA